MPTGDNLPYTPAADLPAVEMASPSVVEIPLKSYQNLVKFLRRAHEHRPNRDVLWCLRLLADYAPQGE